LTFKMSLKSPEQDLKLDLQKTAVSPIPAMPFKNLSQPLTPENMPKTPTLIPVAPRKPISTKPSITPKKDVNKLKQHYNRLRLDKPLQNSPMSAGLKPKSNVTRFNNTIVGGSRTPVPKLMLNRGGVSGLSRQCITPNPIGVRPKVRIEKASFDGRGTPEEMPRTPKMIPKAPKKLITTKPSITPKKVTSRINPPTKTPQKSKLLTADRFTFESPRKSRDELYNSPIKRNE